MVDFGKQFNQGLSAYAQAKKNRSEIREVLEDLNFQIGKVTEGNVQFKIKSFAGVIPKKSLSLSATLALGFAPAQPRDIVWEDWLIAYHNGNQSFERKLGIWTQGNDGYPVGLEVAGESWDAVERKGLENMLGRLLALPTTGQAMEAIMNYVPKVVDTEN